MNANQPDETDRPQTVIVDHQHGRHGLSFMDGVRPDSSPDVDPAAQLEAECASHGISSNSTTAQGLEFTLTAAQTPAAPIEHHVGDLVIKDSGKRQDFDTGAVRDTQEGKGRFDLLPTIAIADLARLFEAGAKKYGDRNWMKGMPLSRYMDSALRHLFKALEGHEDEPHLIQCAFNVLACHQTRQMVRAGLLPAELDDVPSLVTNIDYPDVDDDYGLVMLYGGGVSLVDRCMLGEFRDSRCHLGRDGYAMSSKHHLPIHQVILGDPPDKTVEIDHGNGNRLDNRKENLRWATRAENSRNQGLRSTNKSGFKGVSASGERWSAQIHVNYHKINLGKYDTLEEAAIAYDEGARKYFGEFARLNFPRNSEYGVTQVVRRGTPPSGSFHSRATRESTSNGEAATAA